MLRKLERKDLLEINTWQDQQRIIECLGGHYIFFDNENDEKWVDGYTSSRNNWFCYAIVDKEEDIIVGGVSLTDVDFINRKAILHIQIKQMEDSSLAIGSFAAQEMLSHAFYNLNLNKIECEATRNNSMLINVLKNNGFVKEGVKRQAININRKYVDVIIFSILKQEYDGKYDASNSSYSPVCIASARNHIEKEKAILAFQEEFKYKKIDYDLLIKKIRSAADVLIAYREKIVGYCAFYANNYSTQEAYITMIAVNREWQSKHVGKMLLEAVIYLAKDRGMTKIRLEVDNNNYKAIRFYVNNGFEVVEKSSSNTSYMIRIL